MSLKYLNKLSLYISKALLIYAMRNQNKLLASLKQSGVMTYFCQAYSIQVKPCEEIPIFTRMFKSKAAKINVSLHFIGFLSFSLFSFSKTIYCDVLKTLFSGWSLHSLMSTQICHQQATVYHTEGQREVLSGQNTKQSAVSIHTSQRMCKKKNCWITTGLSAAGLVRLNTNHAQGRILSSEDLLCFGY